MFGLFKRKPKVPSHLTSDEEPQPFVWMHRVIRRPSPPVVWPLESEAFHGWRVKPNPELGLERDTYFLNANAPEFTFATPWPITTRAFLDSLSTDVLHKPEHWSKIDPRDVFLYDADEVREAFSEHERYLLSDLRDANAEQLKVIRNHNIKLTPASPDTEYLKLSPDRHPMLDRDNCVILKPECQDKGASPRTLRVNPRQLHQDRIAYSFGLILNEHDAQILSHQFKEASKFYAQVPITV